MRLLLRVCYLVLHLSSTNCYMEDITVTHEGERNTLYDTDSPFSEDPQSGGGVLALRNRRNDNLSVKFVDLSAESFPKNSFSQGEVIRLESEVVTEASVSGVWFQVRQDSTRFSSYSGTEGANSRYSVELDHLDPGEYYWRVAVRKSREYELSTEYSFTIQEITQTTKPSVTKSGSPTSQPYTGSPSLPTRPTEAPVSVPTPTLPVASSISPTMDPVKTRAPNITNVPTPTLGSSRPPTVVPVTSPTIVSTMSPTIATKLTETPTQLSTAAPTMIPSPKPTFESSMSPTPESTGTPTLKLSTLPTTNPSPNESPSSGSTLNPTEASVDSLSPTPVPAPRPTTSQPTPRPTVQPTIMPTPSPSSRPTLPPTLRPTPLPTQRPTLPPVPTSTITYGLQDDCRKVDNSKFNICLDLRSESGKYEPWMEAFGRARDRWQEIIVQDGLAPVDIRGLYPKDQIATELPSLVDDLYVAGNVVSIDGLGGVIGTAGPNLVRDVNGITIPLSGVMRFDKDDVASLGDEEWNAVILHELGHVLGFGTLFESNGLHAGGMSSDVYLGANAGAEWQKLCPNGRIPIETDGGAGTAGGHWDEECLRGELMTGFLSGDSATVSRLTIAAFKDLGYGVNMDAADAYSVSDLGDCGGYCPSLRRGLRPEARFDLRRVKVSAAGRQLVLGAAAKELQARRTEIPSQLAEGLTYVGGDKVTVYIRDFDGILKEDIVSFDDVRETASFENIRDHIPQTGILEIKRRRKANIHNDTIQLR